MVRDRHPRCADHIPPAPLEYYASPIQRLALFFLLPSALIDRGRSVLLSLSLSSSLLLAKHSAVCFGVFPTCLDKMTYAQYALKENKKLTLA